MLLLQRLLIVLLSITLPAVTYLYFYPVFHGCGFPYQDASFDNSASDWHTLRQLLVQKKASANLKAPFRLLTLGDPQLEGDTSIPDTKDGYFPTLRTLLSNVRSASGISEGLKILKDASKEVLSREVPAKFQAWRKQVDLFGNDYYLAHIYRTLHWYTEPTHSTVLGDLLGSQWIDDDEFQRRGWRFWQRVFRHGQRVGDEITGEATQEVLGVNQEWNRRIMNVAGNHDVGYAGDMTEERIERFERTFGKANWEVRFQFPLHNGTNATNPDLVPELRIVVLNSMNLDTPAKSEDLQTQTYSFINEVIGRSRPVEDRTTGTILLTHIPLHKEEGVCVDAPFFDFHGEHDGGGVKEQNHISYDAGKGILEGVYGMSGNIDGPGGGMGRNGIILTGHDHQGCDVYHHLPVSEDGSERHWNATIWRNTRELLSQSIPGIREITVRSMMGDFGGNAGLLSAWFDSEAGEWQFAYSTCPIGVQHIWWAIHVLLIVTTGLLVFVCSSLALDPLRATRIRKENGHVKEYTQAATPAASKTTPIGNGSIRKRRR
ncbi:hypothetical protein MMC30_008245 [Trapelia coarctata]|nr:hypothetical protein [Trapelia coarctata]